MSTPYPRHNTWHENVGGAYPSILSMTWLGLAAPASGSCDHTPRAAFFRSRHATTGAVRCAVCHRPFATGTSVPYDARPGSPGFDTEVSHATQERTPRRRLVSRSPVNEGRASPPRLGSNAERASSAATKSSERSSAATIHARVCLAGDFKNCCMLSGEFDGSDRHHFFQRVTTPSDDCRWGSRVAVCLGPRDQVEGGPAAPLRRSFSDRCPPTQRTDAGGAGTILGQCGRDIA